MRLLVNGMVVVCCTNLCTATASTAMQGRAQFAEIRHANIKRKLESSWQCETVGQSAESKVGAMTEHLPPPSSEKLGQRYVLAYTDQLAQTEHLRGFHRTFRGIARFMDLAANPANPVAEKDLRRSKLDTVTASYVQHDPPERYEFLGLDRRSTNELPKNDPHLTDLLKIDPLITDLAYVLPPPQSSIGDQWDVPIESITTVLAPGSMLLPPIDCSSQPTPKDGLWFHGVPAFIELNADWLLIGATGTATGTLVKISNDVDGPIAVIQVKFNLKNTRDAADDLRAAVQGAVPEGTRYEYKHVVELEMQGEGELRWRIEAGYAQQYTVRADVEVKERARAAVHLPPGSKHPEQSGTLTYQWKGKVEGKGSGEELK